ncbi:MAG: hypothetical protein JNL98_14045 [Bryobacterales bacterium]|nr:hypothetical protein [Bryobacterales bacterium]
MDEQARRSLKQQVRVAAARRAYHLYKRLDLGPGGYSIAPSTETKRGVTLAIRKKLRK